MNGGHESIVIDTSKAECTLSCHGPNGALRDASCLYFCCIGLEMNLGVEARARQI